MIHLTGRPELACRPGHQREFRIDHAAGAEIAADVLHEDADLLRRHTKYGGEIVLEPHRAAVAGIDGEASRRGVVVGERAARLHRHAGDALYPGFEAGDMRGAGEGGGGRGGVAKLGIEAHVGADAFVHDGRILPRRGGGLDHRRQHVIIDLDGLDAVLRRIDGLGDHHRHRFADEARFVGRQRKMRRLEWRLAALVAQRGLRRMRRPRLVRNGL